MEAESRNQVHSRNSQYDDPTACESSEEEDYSDSYFRDEHETLSFTATDQKEDFDPIAKEVENLREFSRQLWQKIELSARQPCSSMDFDKLEEDDLSDEVQEEDCLALSQQCSSLQTERRKQLSARRSKGLKRKKSRQNKAPRSKTRKKDIFSSQIRKYQEFESDKDQSGYDTDSEDELVYATDNHPCVVDAAYSVLEKSGHHCSISSATSCHSTSTENLENEDSDYPELDSDIEIDDPMFFRDDGTMPLPDFDPIVESADDNDANDGHIHRHELHEENDDENSDDGYESDQEDARKGFALIPTQQGMAIRFKNFQSIVPYLNSLLPGQLNQSGVLNLHYHPSTYPFTRNALSNFQRNIAAAFDQPIVDEVIVIDSDSEDESDEVVTIDSDSEDETNEVITIESDSEDESQEDDLPQQQIDNREDVSAGIASDDSLPRYESGSIEHEELIDEAIDGSVENLNSQEVTLENPILEEQPQHQWYLDSSISPLVQSSLVNEQPNEVFLAENSSSENMPPCSDGECQADDDLDSDEVEVEELCFFENRQNRDEDQDEEKDEDDLLELASLEQREVNSVQLCLEASSLETNDVNGSREYFPNFEESYQFSPDMLQERSRTPDRMFAGNQRKVIYCYCGANHSNESYIGD
eukprot:gene14784-5890_t